jgi:predicted GIY-YIG superfamily endonuclease
MNKYDNFVIYKIYQTEFPDILYIGSTTNFSNRKSSHKKNCNNRVSKKYHYPIYQYIRNCGGFEQFKIEIVEKFPCKTKNEGLLKEKELIKFYNAKLNTIKPIKDGKTLDLPLNL